MLFKQNHTTQRYDSDESLQGWEIRYLQQHQGFPWDLQDLAFRVILEDQRDLFFQGDLLTQAHPFTQENDSHENIWC